VPRRGAVPRGRQRLNSPQRAREFRPGSIHLSGGTTATRTRPELLLTGGVGTASDSARQQAPPVKGGLIFNERDVIRQIARLQKPGDVAQWWASEPRAHPDQWLHPLSSWEREYIEAMASPTAPAPVRMQPPAAPGNLLPQEARGVEQLMGRDPATAERYPHLESRRRIVAHYVLTHPATLRLQLGLYGLVRDFNPLHFALERGWQVGRGKEMFTEQDVSQLGAAAEFFAALAVGVALEKAVGLAHPLAVRGSAPPYMTPEVEKAFVTAVRVRAEHMVRALSNTERGPVLTGVLDTRTGRTFFGVNLKDPPPGLHPLLQERLDDYIAKLGGVKPTRWGELGSHSEIVALSRALYEREAALGRSVEPQELSEFVLHNRSLHGPRKIQGIPPPCPNCEAILPPQVRVLP
jgi:hypothetical protein